MLLLFTKNNIPLSNHLLKYTQNMKKVLFFIVLASIFYLIYVCFVPGDSSIDPKSVKKITIDQLPDLARSKGYGIVDGTVTAPYYFVLGLYRLSDKYGGSVWVFTKNIPPAEGTRITVLGQPKIIFYSPFLEVTILTELAIVASGN
jgi:hypothetical protein